MVTRTFPLILSASGAARIDAAVSFLTRVPASQPITIVAFTREAADDLVRRVAATRPATLGLARYSLTQLAARIAAPRLGGAGLAPATALGAEAVAARTVFDATGRGTLGYFASVAATPGFPRALSSTFTDLRAAGIDAPVLDKEGPVGVDLGRLLGLADRAYEESSVAERTALFLAARDGIDADPSLRAPLLLLDVTVDSTAEAAFLTALVGAAAEACATVPAHDGLTRDQLEAMGGTAHVLGEPGGTDLARLRVSLFAADSPAARRLDGSLELFSAPGEGRECVEIARRILREARRGVRFDEMAVLVRSPQQYQGLLEHALHRARIPAWFDRGTRRPHPAGRAFLALLACAADGLSAKRFAEYLSLGQLPAEGGDGSTWAPSADEVAPAQAAAGDADSTDEEIAASDDHEVDDDQPALAGTLRTPRHWERLIADASVIGGGAERWRRRLDGLAAEFEARRVEALRADPDSPQALGIARDLARLAHLRSFALPLITEMGAWSPVADWGFWLERLSALAPRVLRSPAYVLRVLADLRPMAAIGPVGLDEVRAVLQPRLLTIESRPPLRRYGRVFVAGPAHARGRSFRVVFVPGLAERLFPQKSRQDPLLPDAVRERLDARLLTSDERARRERLLLHLAAGAASERLYVSYPRIQVTEGRARVPSFYALDLMRVATGHIPDHETLEEAAARAGDPTLAWPAPADPADAIDDQEHDLSVLRRLLDAEDPASVRGHAQYLLALNGTLRRSVTDRWARAEPRWSHHDGLIRVTDATRASLGALRFSQRAYSLSALQRFASCPYQFLLSARYRLQPAEPPVPLQRLDPLTRGSLVHRIQALFFRSLKARRALPVTPASKDAALDVLQHVIGQVAEEYRERLLPAVDRVWRDEIAAVGRDLRGWVDKLASDGGSWTPEYFELAFGLERDDQRDPGSVPDAVMVGGRFPLRGSIDLVERARDGASLRVTDHKTGRNRTAAGLAIAGGTVLQPVLYSLVVEAMTGLPTNEARLSFCTVAGGFTEAVVRMSDVNRRYGIETLEIIDRSIEQGFLAAAPAEGACGRCDFGSVCGPDEEQRLRRKPAQPLRDLVELRSRP